MDSTEEVQQVDHEYYQLEGDFQSTTNEIELDIDSTVKTINLEYDDQALNEMMHQLLSIHDIKLKSLKKIQQYTVGLENSNQSSKYHVTELEELLVAQQRKADGRQMEINSKKLQLNELKIKQVEEVAKFENYVHKMSKKFMEGPKNYNSQILQQSIEELQNVLSHNKSVLKQHKEELIQENDKIKYISSDDDSFIKLHKSFGDSVSEIDSSNKKLNVEVEQLSTELNRERVKFELLSKLNNDK